METSPLPVTPTQWKRLMKLDGEPVLTLFIRRPTFPEMDKSGRMERYFSELSQKWQQRWEQILFPRACRSLDEAHKTGKTFIPWQAQLDYTVTLWQPPLLSLRLDVTEQSSTTCPVQVCIGETWDCSIGYPRSLRSFFSAKNHRWRKELMDALHAQAKERLLSGMSLLDPNCTQIMERSFDPERFYLSEEGIVLYYPLYILGPYAEGIPTFAVPKPE